METHIEIMRCAQRGKRGDLDKIDAVQRMQDEICRLIPTRIDFKHQHDTPTDAAGHVKCSLLGVSIPLIIDGGKLVLGGSQGIFFLEFDGPRKRKYYVKLISDKA